MDHLPLQIEAKVIPCPDDTDTIDPAFRQSRFCWQISQTLERLLPKSSVEEEEEEEGAAEEELSESSSLARDLESLEELCYHTLGRRKPSVGPTGPAPPPVLVVPKSPQERFRRAFVTGSSSSSSPNSGSPGLSPGSHNRKFVRTKTSGSSAQPSQAHKPIIDMAVMVSGDSLPEGFEKIERSPSGIRADLNKGM